MLFLPINPDFSKILDFDYFRGSLTASKSVVLFWFLIFQLGWEMSFILIKKIKGFHKDYFADRAKIKSSSFVNLPTKK